MKKLLEERSFAPGVMTIVVWFTVLTNTLLWVLPVHAHVERGQAAGFLTGLAHPISGWDHVLAMIAVGLWGAQLGSPAIWILPVTFPMVMAFGGMLGLIGIPVPGVEIGIAASAIALGVMVLGEIRPRLAVAAVLVGFFAVFHGPTQFRRLTPSTRLDFVGTRSKYGHQSRSEALSQV